MALDALHGTVADHHIGRGRARSAVLLVVAALALAACSGGTAVESAAPAPTPEWEPTMAAPGTEPLPDETGDAVQAAVEAYLADTGLVGATAAVVHADGVWQGASGSDGAGTELVPDSAMAVMSITKTFTAAVVMSLAEDGQVDLDAPIDDYIDLPFETEGATVRQVLNMRSGFPVDSLDNVALQVDLDRSWTVDEVLQLHEGATNRDGTLGGVQAYNNVNFWSLQVLVEDVTGQPIAEVVRDRFADPAGLDRTWWQDAEQPQPPLTVAVDQAGRTTVDPDGPWMPSRSWASAIGAGGGMASVAADIARWGYLLYGGYLLQPDTVAEMTTSGQPEGYPCDWDSASTCYYGLGTMLYEDSSIGHDGGGLSYQALLQVWPENDLSVAVLVPATVESAKPGSPWLDALAADIRAAVQGA